jgi:hypothetical protein
VVDDDAQIGNRRAKCLHLVLRVLRAAADDVERHPAPRQVAQVGELCRAERDSLRPGR